MCILSSFSGLKMSQIDGKQNGECMTNFDWDVHIGASINFK